MTAKTKIKTTVEMAMFSRYEIPRSF